jgi:hypothetical protein
VGGLERVRPFFLAGSERKSYTIESMAMTRSSFQALPLTQNEHRFYFATIPVDDIFPYCFVARRQEDPIAGFQRTLSLERANDIARYLSAGNGSSDPTSVVLRASPIEIASVLLADVELLLDHAAEHQASLYSAIEMIDWCSPA